MSGFTAAIRNTWFSHALRGGAAPGATSQVVEWTLVTAVNATMEGGGALSNEMSLTGLSRIAVGTTVNAPTDGVGDNTLLDFGTAASGVATQTYTHVVGVNASDACVVIGQLTNAGRTVAVPLVVDTATNDRIVRVPATNISFQINDIADVA